MFQTQSVKNKLGLSSVNWLSSGVAMAFQRERQGLWDCHVATVKQSSGTPQYPDTVRRAVISADRFPRRSYDERPPRQRGDCSLAASCDVVLLAGFLSEIKLKVSKKGTSEASLFFFKFCP